MAFPTAEGPTTVDLVKAQLTIDDDVDDTLILGVVDAVNVKVQSWPVAQDADTDPAAEDWSAWAHIVLGATMLAARLWRRRNTPDGVAGFSDAGPAYVSRYDPDVALLLQVGTNTKPAVG